jgi:transcriptional regulator with XRE-family HTH domain
MLKSGNRVSKTPRDQQGERLTDNFGQVLRKARRIRNLTLNDLANRVGCSASTLSKIENKKTTPSLGMVYRICKALRMNVTTLLANRENSSALVTRAGRHPMYQAAGMEFSLLLPSSPEHRMEATIADITPGARSDEPMEHGTGELFGFVLEGKLRLKVDGKTYNVQAGDSFAFSYDRPHSFGNPGARRTRVLFVLAPPVDFAWQSRTRDGTDD